MHKPGRCDQVAIVAETQTEPEIEGEWVLMNVSAYTAGYESTGKTP